MEEVFRSFCSFGADKGGATPLMDGSKLVKLCRDQQLLDKNLTQTDVDIIYSKVKSKTERKINFKQFEMALKMMADKKFPATEDSLEKLKAKILEGGGPVARGVTKTLKTGAVDRLTDASKTVPVKADSPRTRDAKASSNRPGSGNRRPHSTPSKTVNGKADLTTRVKSSVGGKSDPKSAKESHETKQDDPALNQESAVNGAKGDATPDLKESCQESPSTGNEAVKVDSEKTEVVEASANLPKSTDAPNESKSSQQ